MAQVGKQIRKNLKKILEDKEAAKIKAPIVKTLEAALTAVWLYLETQREMRESMPYEAVDRLFGNLNPLLVKEVLEDAIHNRTQRWLEAVEDSELRDRESSGKLKDTKGSRVVSKSEASG